MTPSISSRGIDVEQTLVAHTTAWFGPRPVANALGCSLGEMATRGIGSPARCGERLDHAVELGVRRARSMTLARGRREGQLVAEPVRAADHHEGDGRGRW